MRTNESDNAGTRLILAPIRGVTGAIFRNVFAACFSGFDAAVAPFIPTTKGAEAALRHYRDVLPENNNSWELHPQLLGNDPDDFIQAANQLAALGYSCVNWNLGCPMPTVTRKHRGSALLSEPLRIQTFLANTIPALQCRISVKVRLGYTHADELLQLMPIFNDFEIAEIIIHPRTASQMYDGTIDLERFSQCYAISRHPVVLSGDITQAEQMDTLKLRFPQISGWMIGRGALCDPFLPMRIKALPLPPHPLNTIQEFHDELYRRYCMAFSGPASVLGAMKELWAYLAGNFNDGERWLKKIRKTTKLPAYENIIAEMFYQNMQAGS